ncbi:hypothetical protein GF325_00615 [Candidatus Bathyarchaeota archaeon]|nr:hypothetical protein [Candidatus Bathyarchaeota archaeon]
MEPIHETTIHRVDIPEAGIEKLFNVLAGLLLEPRKHPLGYTSAYIEMEERGELSITFEERHDDEWEKKIASKATQELRFTLSLVPSGEKADLVVKIGTRSKMLAKMLKGNAIVKELEKAVFPMFRERANLAVAACKKDASIEQLKNLPSSGCIKCNGDATHDEFWTQQGHCNNCWGG